MCCHDGNCRCVRVLAQGGAAREVPGKYNKNDMKATWISQPGLLKMCASSGLIGEEFSIWIFEEVIPSIMATGQYSVGAPQPSQQAESGLWNQQRLDGIELFKLKNASLQKLLACCVGGAIWPDKFKIINGAINRAILDYNCSKGAFLLENNLPQTASIPELLAFDGQLLRGMMGEEVPGLHQRQLERAAEDDRQGDGVQLQCCGEADAGGQQGRGVHCAKGDAAVRRGDEEEAEGAGPGPQKGLASIPLCSEPDAASAKAGKAVCFDVWCQILN